MLLHYLRENKINWNFFSSVLLKQSIFEHSKLFVIGIADGYDEALFLVEEIVQDVYQETKSANARQFLLTDQAEYEKKRAVGKCYISYSLS